MPQMSFRTSVRVAPLLALCALLALPAGASAARPPLSAPAIEILSNRADLISAGDVLVAVRLPRGARRVRVSAGRRKRDALVRTPSGRPL